METRAKRYREVEDLDLTSISVGNDKLNNLISSEKGFITPSTILLTGSSGAGKTTLIKFLQKCIPNYRTALLSREMPGSVVKKQTAGIDIDHDNAFIIDDLSFEEFMIELDVLKPKVVFVDSLQVVAKEDFPSIGESEATFHIIQTIRDWGKRNSAVIILVGHVTKDDGFRGDNTIVQMVDAHFEMINFKSEGYRVLRVGQKNRFGNADAELFYTFEIKENKIVGFDLTVEQEEYTLNEVVQNTIASYFNSFDKKQDGFKEFKKTKTTSKKRMVR